MESGTGKTRDIKPGYSSLLIRELKQKLGAAVNIDIIRIASEIQQIGFSCSMCGNCCRLASGDNRVFVTRKEIRDITVYTGLSKSGIATPMMPEDFGPLSISTIPIPEILIQQIDLQGNIHIFGWMLKRRSDGDCKFIEYPGKNPENIPAEYKENASTGRRSKSSAGELVVPNRCNIYEVRPMLCRTYPFYLDDMGLQTSECEGLGRKISKEKCLKIARDVIDRYISEIEDTISLYEKFEYFTTGNHGLDIAVRRAKEGRIVYIVHDSEGVEKIFANAQINSNYI